ncbi:MAG TPA: Mur ligase family protein, partial [Opitutales bacterium]|nr:Mur ligase family protein [Opitutales bacterium]
MLLQSTVEELMGKPVAILGNGVSGQAFERLLRSLGGRGVVFDEAFPDGTSRDFGDVDQSGFDLVVNSPGFRKDHPWISAAIRSQRLQLSSETEAAAQFWKGRIVAVTGTNGKTTVTGLLAHALCAGGWNARVAGNVGVPFSDCVMDSHSSDDWAVLEVSSFQAWNFSGMRLDGVIWTNFDEDHLDWHESLEDYFASKWRL